ncbi:MAG: hypothetical protein ACJ8AW_29030, partial [Rhodopila sp.]
MSAAEWNAEGGNFEADHEMHLMVSNQGDHRASVAVLEKFGGNAQAIHYGFVLGRSFHVREVAPHRKDTDQHWRRID